MYFMDGMERLFMYSLGLGGAALIRRAYIEGCAGADDGADAGADAGFLESAVLQAWLERVGIMDACRALMDQVGAADDAVRAARGAADGVYNAVFEFYHGPPPGQEDLDLEMV
jgi:hypothetical protein